MLVDEKSKHVQGYVDNCRNTLHSCSFFDIITVLNCLKLCEVAKHIHSRWITCGHLYTYLSINLLTCLCIN